MMQDDIQPALPAASDERTPDPRAEAFQGAREARRNEVAEDYVELIAELIDATRSSCGSCSGSDWMPRRRNAMPKGSSTM